MARPDNHSLFARVEGLPIIIVFAILLALFMFTAPQVFLAPNIYTTFLTTLPPLIILAVGLTFVIGAGEIDLCFPSIIAFSGFVFAVLFKEYNLGWLAVVAAHRVRRSFIGFVNGILVARIGIPSFITTLGTQFFWAGMATVISGRQVLCPARASTRPGSGQLHRRAHRRGRRPHGLVDADLDPGRSGPRSIVVALWFVLNRHRFGEHVLFLGDSNEVSRVVGIPVEREKIKLFTLMGGPAAVAAVMLTLENRNYFGNQGQGYLLTAIAAVLIGGTSIFGGRATIVGTFFGAFIMGMIEAGLVASSLTGAWVRTVQGLIFLVAIIFYLVVDEPHRRAAFMARFRRRERCRPHAIRRNQTRQGGTPTGPNPASSNLEKTTGRTTMSMKKSLLAGAAGLMLAAVARARGRRRDARQGRDDLHADGRPVGRRPGACARGRRHRRRPRAWGSTRSTPNIRAGRPRR